MTQEGFSLMAIDDFERSGPWMLARRGLGVEAFGLNVVDVPPGESIPEHDEAGRDQEEVFVFLGGEASMVIDGEAHAAAAGMFVRVNPRLRRTVRNDGSEPARVLIVSAPCTSGYVPMEWA